MQTHLRTNPLLCQHHSGNLWLVERDFLFIVAAFVGFWFVSLVCHLKKNKNNLYLADLLHLISGQVDVFDNMTSAHLESNTYINLRVHLITLSS